MSRNSTLNRTLNRTLGTSLWMAAGLLVAAAAPAAELEEAVQQGRALFERQWISGELSTLGGDGLGPVFNHVSCAACHRQGGLGGSGPIDVNAVMLSVSVPKLPEAPQRREFLAALKAAHSGFVSAGGDIRPNLIVHRFGA